MIDTNKVLIGLGQHISGRAPERCGSCPYFNGDSGYGVTCRDELLDDLYEMLEAQDEKCRACGEKTNNAIQALQAELKSQEPHVLTLEQACVLDYCFYEYRATGYVGPASVVLSGVLLNGTEPLVEVYRLERKGAAYVAMKDYGHEWRCWDRMPEYGQKEVEPWN